MRGSEYILSLMIWVALCLAVGFIAGRFSPGEWYASLNKPGWTPPGWVFPVVWTILYVMMGLSAWIICQEVGLRAAALPLSFFLLQLVFNGLWTYLFFGLQRPGLAFVEITLLWVLILVTLILFWINRPLAGALLLPYLIWVGFASGLNFAIWRMN